MASNAFGAALRITRLPKYGPMVVPSALNACARFSRLEAVSSGPRTVTYGLAETCRAVIPAATIISAVKTNGNETAVAAPMNKKAPTAIVHKPITIVFLYPNHSTSVPAGMEKMKYRSEEHTSELQS